MPKITFLREYKPNNATPVLTYKTILVNIALIGTVLMALHYSVVPKSNDTPRLFSKVRVGLKTGT